MIGSKGTQVRVSHASLSVVVLFKAESMTTAATTDLKHSCQGNVRGYPQACIAVRSRGIMHMIQEKVRSPYNCANEPLAARHVQRGEETAPTQWMLMAIAYIKVVKSYCIVLCVFQRGGSARKRPKTFVGGMSGLEYTAQELGTVLQGATATSLPSSRRHVFHLLTDVAAVVKLATRVRRRPHSPPPPFCRLEPSPSARPAVCARPPPCPQIEVCSAHDQLERAFLQLLTHPLKLVCTPVQITLAECYVALFEWGDSRKLTDSVHNLLKVVGSKADASNRVCVGPVCNPNCRDLH